MITAVARQQLLAYARQRMLLVTVAVPVPVSVPLAITTPLVVRSPTSATAWHSMHLSDDAPRQAAWQAKQSTFNCLWPGISWPGPTMRCG